MDSEKLFLDLAPADSDAPLHSPDYQQELIEVGRALTAQGIKATQVVELEEAAGHDQTTLLGYAVEASKVFWPAFAGIIVGWLQGRYGRKARIKIGDFEVEARTPKEVDKLIASVEAFLDHQKGKRRLR